MRRGGSTTADARCSTTADQKHECQNAEDTSTYKMCVMTRFFSPPYLHGYASLPDRYELLIFRSRFVTIHT